MRSFSAILLAMFMWGCGGTSYVDLRQPIYLIPRKSFWSGCETDPAGYKSCRLDRIKQARAGINEWFNYFPKGHRPVAIIVASEKNIPPHPINAPIYLAIGQNICTKDGSVACYGWWQRESEIIFISAEFISGLMGHEFGHALGRDDNDVPEGTESVMSYRLPTTVTPLDIRMMCKYHFECRMVKQKPRRK